MFTEIKLVITDVDGVLTNGNITYDENGVEYTTFHARDGAGVVYLKRVGIPTAIISGRKSQAVYVRAEELGIEDVYLGMLNKTGPYEELKSKYKLEDSEIAYLGDDLTDLPLLTRAGLSIAVADASREVLQAAKFVTTACGGKGAFREVAELILKAQGKWSAELERYK